MNSLLLVQEVDDTIIVASVSKKLLYYIRIWIKRMLGDFIILRNMMTSEILPGIRYSNMESIRIING